MASMKVSSKVSGLRHGGDRPGSPVHRGAAPAGASGAGPKPRAMIAINGGRSMLWQLAAAAEAKIPILMLQGTGRLCDNVPKVWLQRSNGSFDAEATILYIYIYIYINAHDIYIYDYIYIYIYI